MSIKSIVLVVDSNRSTLGLVSQQLAQAGYETLAAASMEELDQATHGKAKIALALIDISGFDRHIWERCEQLSKLKTPCIVISPQRSPAVQRESMKHGAAGVLVKPLDFTDLLEHIHSVLGD
jgi:DNA-binding response OmpR family regulator